MHEFYNNLFLLYFTSRRLFTWLVITAGDSGHRSALILVTSYLDVENLFGVKSK